MGQVAIIIEGWEFSIEVAKEISGIAHKREGSIIRIDLCSTQHSTIQQYSRH